MGYYLIAKSSLKGQLTIPSSKSHTLRAILFGALGKGKTIIKHYLHSPDTYAMIKACQLLGSQINSFLDHLEIEGLDGRISSTEDIIQAGNSGIVLRFISAISALSSHYTVITGDYSIRHQRPIQSLLDGLNQLGVLAISTRQDGYAPVIIRGSLRSGTAVINGEDSQPVSALLIASAFAEGPIELTVNNPGEKPWILLTLDWFDRLGIRYDHQTFEHYRLEGNNHYEGFNYIVPGDWSSAAFPIAAALITQSEVIIHNLDNQDTQGDKELIEVLKKMGAQIEIDDQAKTLAVKTGGGLQGIEIDINRLIDAITILAVIACFAEGETRITNAAVARQKECDRLHAITLELQKMGANITELADGLIIKHSPLQGAYLYSHQDHRMALALTVAALGANGESKIDGIECVAKTYPNFVQDFQALGAAIEVKQ